MSGYSQNSPEVNVKLVGDKSYIRGSATIQWPYVPQLGSTINMDDIRYIVMHVDHGVDSNGIVTSYVECVASVAPITPDAEENQEDG